MDDLGRDFARLIKALIAALVVVVLLFCGLTAYMLAHTR